MRANVLYHSASPFNRADEKNAYLSGCNFASVPDQQPHKSHSSLNVHQSIRSAIILRSRVPSYAALETWRHLLCTNARIRVTYWADVERAYKLLPAYIENPDLALSVQEFIPDPHVSDRWLGDTLGPSLPISDSGHAAIINYVEELGLGPDLTRVMLDSLDWWRLRWGVHAAQAWTPDDSAIYRNPRAKAWEQADAFSGTVTVVMLSLCRNVNTIYFSSVGLNDCNVLIKYLRASNYGLIPNPALQGLKHVKRRDPGPIMDDWIYLTFEFLDMMRCVHRLPQITSISMERITDRQTVSEELFPPSTSKSLKQIHLGHVLIKPDLLSTIVRIPTGLEELSLSFGGLFNPDYPPNINPALLSKALRQHKDTLRILFLDLGCGEIHGPSEEYAKSDDDEERDEMEVPSEENKYYHDIDLESSQGTLRAYELEDEHKSNAIGSLRDYMALVRLSITFEALLTGFYPFWSVPYEEPEFRLIDILPPNLEYLCLFGYEKGKSPEMDDHVTELMDGKAERLPNLKEVVGMEEFKRGVWLKPEKYLRYNPTIEDLEKGWQGSTDAVDCDWLEV